MGSETADRPSNDTLDSPVLGDGALGDITDPFYNRSCWNGKQKTLAAFTCNEMRIITYSELNRRSMRSRVSSFASGEASQLKGHSGGSWKGRRRQAITLAPRILHLYSLKDLTA